MIYILINPIIVFTNKMQTTTTRTTTERKRSPRTKITRTGTLPKRRKYVKRRGRVSMTKSLGLVVPDSVMVKFKACDTWTLSKLAASSTEPLVSFYSNNPYDPVVGVSTTKCTGFDDLMTFYKHGVCYGFKIVCHFILTTNITEHWAYIQHTDHTQSPSSWLTMNQIAETGICDKYKLIYSYVFKIPGRDVLTSYKSIKALEKVRDLSTDQYSFTKTSGPTLQTRCNVGARSADSSVSSDFYMRATIEMTYYCRLFERQLMTE